MNNVYKFSEIERRNGKALFSVSFKVSDDLDKIFSVSDKWDEQQKAELTKYVGLKIRQRSKDADLLVDIPNENINNRNVNYKEVNWLLDGILLKMPEVAYWAMDGVVSFMEKNIKGGQRALLTDMFIKDGDMFLAFEVKTNLDLTGKLNKGIDDLVTVANDIAAEIEKISSK